MRWNPDTYGTHANFVPKLGEEVLHLLRPQRGEDILDLGCGDGALTAKIAAAGAAVRGVDSSAELVDAACALGINASACDAHDITYEGEFDAVFSNAALHWMKRDPDEVLRRVWRALRPGGRGRFCAEFGAAGNIATIAAALRDTLRARGLKYEDYNPWFFPEAEDYQQRLQAAGFSITHWQVFNRPTPLPTDILGWLTVFAKSFLRDIPPQEHAAFLNAVAAHMEEKLKRKDGVWVADYVRCRFLAVKG